MNARSLEEVDLCYATILFLVVLLYSCQRGCNSSIQQLDELLDFHIRQGGGFMLDVRSFDTISFIDDNPLCCVFIPFW
jgi:hypothetical protein